MTRVVLGSTAIVLLLFGCGKQEQTLAEPESRPVKMKMIDVGDASSYRSFPAVVEAGDKAVLAFRVSGVLAEVNVRAGQDVNKGQVLAQLNQDEFLLQVEQAQANYALANVQFKRDAQLRKTNVVSELDFDTSKAELNQAEAALSKQKSNLGYTRLIAPYDGTVSLKMKENYEYVMIKEPVMHIQRAGIIDITFQLPEQLLARFQSDHDHDPSVIFDTIPGQTFAAKFKEIDTEADPTNSSYKVTLWMQQPEGKNILPGMAAAVRITLPKNNQGNIPPQALVRDNDALFVWLVNANGLVEKREVVLDPGGRVLSGLNDGDTIAISGVLELQEGQRVRPWIKERGL